MMVNHAMKSYKSRAKRKAQATRIFLLVIGLGLIFASLIIALRSYTQYASQPEIIPYQTEIEGVPLGGLSLEEASQRIQEAFDTPSSCNTKMPACNFLPPSWAFSSIQRQF